jgi:tRNA (cmo5U34)-methyltransferase
MMNGAVEAFETNAVSYDSARRRLVPVFDDFYGTAVAALSLASEPPGRVLDLGAGTGLLAAHVRAALPSVQLTLLDGAGAMLEQARRRLGDEGVTYVTGDLRDALPRGSWDAIVSALAIHHLDDQAKRAVFARIRGALRPGGVFVNAEQVSGPTPAFTAVYESWQERSARALGSDDAEWDGAVARMRHDRCATVEDQLAWLRAAGFDEADCLFKHHRFAVLVARRAG